MQKMGMKRKLPVVFSTEQADQDAVILVDDEKNKKSTAGTVSYMPAVFGCYLAASCWRSCASRKSMMVALGG